MPWELQILPTDGTDSLGSVEHMQAKLRAAVPEIRLFRDASGPVKLAAMESRGIEVPVVLREHMLSEKGEYQGLIQGDRFSIEFYLGEDENAVDTVAVHVRGSGDPMPVIERLTAIPGWTVVDPNGRPPATSGWKSFGTWRDDGVRRIEDGA